MLDVGSLLAMVKHTIHFHRIYEEKFLHLFIFLETEKKKMENMTKIKINAECGAICTRPTIFQSVHQMNIVECPLVHLVHAPMARWEDEWEWPTETDTENPLSSWLITVSPINNRVFYAVSTHLTLPAMHIRNSSICIRFVFHLLVSIVQGIFVSFLLSGHWSFIFGLLMILSVLFLVKNFFGVFSVLPNFSCNFLDAAQTHT